MRKKALFTIDVDPLGCYYDIHGVKRPEIEKDPLLLTALPRMLAWLEAYDIKATLFVTAGELGEDEKSVILNAYNSGHEISSHSFSHDYRLTQQPIDTIREDIKKNSQAIEAITSEKPVGFRAPGYSMSSELYRVLKDEKFSYDASAFPSPFYYCAKWVLIRLKSLMGRKSKSIISSFSEAFTSRTPFLHPRTDLPILPITTVGLFGWPMLGTALLVFPRFFFNHLLNRAVKKEYFHFETHPIDAAGFSDNSLLLEELIPYQPDLKKTLEYKEEAFKQMLATLVKNDFQFVTISEYLKEWSANK